VVSDEAGPARDGEQHDEGWCVAAARPAAGHQIGGERVGLIGRALQQIGEIADSAGEAVSGPSDDSVSLSRVCLKPQLSFVTPRKRGPGRATERLPWIPAFANDKVGVRPKHANPACVSLTRRERRMHDLAVARQRVALMISSSS